jgi:hypothetical protein
MEALPMKHGLPWLVSQVYYYVPKRNMAYLRCDGHDVFQGHHSGVITQVRGQTTLYFLGVHWMAHWMNLILDVCTLRWLKQKSIL